MMEANEVVQAEENVQDAGDNAAEEIIEDEESEDEEETLPEIRSIECVTDSYVVFNSKTSRCVDVFWIDYRGNRVKYATLQPGQKYQIHTFVTHPWRFFDSETRAIIHCNGEEVFMPEESTEERPHYEVNIHIPVYNLLDRCVEEFAHQNPEADLKRMIIPECLKIAINVHNLNKDIDFELYEGFGN